MILWSKKRVQDENQLVHRAENRTIDKVSTQRLLGVFIDDHLSWMSHIDHYVQHYLLKYLSSDKHQHTCLKAYKN